MNLNKYFLASLSLASLFYSCGINSQEVKNEKMNATAVTVAEVVATNAVFYDEYPGNVIALNQINLTAQVSGYITKMNFKDGQNVDKGQLLYSIDAQVYQANYQKAIADLHVQETNLIKAQKDADRYHELDKHDAIAKQQVDYADTNLEVAKKQVEAARANVASVHSGVQFASIYSPFSGTIGISQVKVGTAVVAGQTILNTISTNHPMAVDFIIDQKDIYHFAQLQKNKNEIGDSTFTIAFGSDPYPEPGYISFIDRAVDPQTGTIKIRLIFANDNGMLKPGMNTIVRVRNDVAAQFIVIPYKAVSESLGEFMVYVVGDSSRVSQRQVKLGRQIDDKVIIKEGLNVGELIVVQGVQNLNEGSSIIAERK
ncbi:MAG: efflux RND transporter periplasmic adaptor subunit [Cyclobacteriaceae bacterium]|nr:efflux RND transporter periplasmic adaptor subunit [Cyclobacteriaceae bacterium]